MNKRGILSISQILILILGIFAFTFCIKEVSAPTEAEREEAQQQLNKLIEEKISKYPSTTGTPAHGYYGKVYEWIAGPGTTAESSVGFSVSGIMQGAGWAALVYGLVKLIGPMLGMDKDTTNAAATAMAAGVFVGMSLNSLFGAGGSLATSYGSLMGSLGMTAGPMSALAATGWGLAVAVVVFVLTYKKSETQTVTFTCNPWDAPTGGAYCEKCNQQRDLPCSEYQCRSLGQSCQLVNPNTDEAKCVWVNKNDVKFPVITPLKEALLSDYVYKPDKTISPPDSGVIIWNNKNAKGCAPAFTPLTFGVALDEPGRCKIDFLRKTKFEDMDFFFGGSSLMRYNHTQAMSLPGPNTIENGTPVLQNNGNYDMYVRCEDANGNKNTATFVFKFCIDAGPDTTPPLIITTSLLNNMPFQYNLSSVNLDVYVNEPAECRWSHLDQAYDKMENQMTCATSVLEMNAQMLYKCATNLTGLKSNFNNDFYFRCMDKPRETERNTNSQSYKFTLVGTRPLVLDEVGPNNETIKDSADVVKTTLTAKTSAGYKEGEAMCYYSNTDEEDSYIMFYSTNSHTHSQELWLPEGNYQYYIKCVDLGGNTDMKIINFKVETDTSAPIVVRAFHDSSDLKIITNEESECVYSNTENTGCNYLFDDGISMTSSYNKIHTANWNTGVNFYIKCKDDYDNQPAPDACSIVAGASGI